MVLMYFLTVLLCVLLSSTIGTVLLVRAVQQGHMRRRLARAMMVVLAIGLPLAVPLALAAVFLLAVHAMPWSGYMTVQEASQLNLAIFGSMPAGLVLSLYATITGWRRTRPDTPLN